MPQEQNAAVAMMERDRNEAIAAAAKGSESRTQADEAAIELQSRRAERSKQIDSVFESGVMPEEQGADDDDEVVVEAEEVSASGDDLLGRIGVEELEEVAEEALPASELERELAAVEQIEAPSSLSAKGKEGWAALKTKSSELTKEVYTLKQQLAAREADTGSEAINTLRAENAALKNSLSILDYESSDDFKQKFAEPERRATEALAGTLTGTGISAAQLLAMPEAERDAKVDELVEGMSKVRGNKLVSFITNLDLMRSEKSVALQDVNSKINDIRTQNDAQVQAKRAETVATFDGVQKQFLGDTATLFSPYDLTKAPESQREFQEKFNAGLERVNADARHLGLSENKPEALALGSMKAASFDFVMENVVPEIGRRMVLANAEIARLKKEISGYVKVTPGTNRNAQSRQTAAEAEAARRKVPVRQRVASAINETFGR
jgi:hypothetical protein